jgi:hypothetical protein
MHRAWSLLALAVLATCGKTEPAAPKAPAATEPAPKPPAATEPAPKPPAPAQPAPELRELTVTSAGSTAKVRVKVPASWRAEASGAGVRNAYGEQVAGIGFTVTCDGSCAAAELPGHLARLVGAAPESEARPNYNTGDPKLDAVRLDVEKLDEGDLPDGKRIVLRVRKPAGLEGPYPQGLVAVCARLHPARDRFVVAHARVALEAEKEWATAATEACRTFEVLP